MRWIGALVLSAACTGAPQEPPPEPPAEPLVVPIAPSPSGDPPVDAAEDEARSDAGSPMPSGPTPGDLGLDEVCEVYLRRYEACEPRLRASIQAGERRTPAAERAWLEYWINSPEQEALADGCQAMLAEIAPLCPL